MIISINIFVSIGPDLSSGIVDSDESALDYMGDRADRSFFMLPSDPGEVSRVISSLPKKGSDLYSIPTFVMKYAIEEISPTICELFNLSISTGIFPGCLKLARVFPVYKSGERSSVSNYRPISILSPLSKIFEKLVYSRLSSYLEKFDILTDNQFGFRRLRGNFRCYSGIFV